MDHIVTLNELINISDYIKEVSDKNKQYNELIDEKICDRYDITDIKNQLIDSSLLDIYMSFLLVIPLR